MGWDQRPDRAMVNHGPWPVDKLSLEAVDHIKSSSMDPAILAEQYGIPRRAVDLIQMGRDNDAIPLLKGH